MIPSCVTPGQPHRPDPLLNGPPDPATGRLACSAGEAARLTALSRDLLDDQIHRGDLACIKARQTAAGLMLAGLRNRVKHGLTRPDQAWPDTGKSRTIALARRDPHGQIAS